MTKKEFKDMIIILKALFNGILYHPSVTIFYLAAIYSAILYSPIFLSMVLFLVAIALHSRTCWIELGELEDND